MPEYFGFPVFSPEAIREQIERRLNEATHERLLRQARVPRRPLRLVFAASLRALAARLDDSSRVGDERPLEPVRLG